MTESARALPIAPADVHNQALLANVHPPDWVNPRPAPRYNMVVIGAGTAGLIIAAGAAGLGAKVALIERELMGGDCLNVGCVPSKALLRSARALADARDASAYGVAVAGRSRRRFSRRDGADAPPARRTQRQGFGGALSRPGRGCLYRRGPVYGPRHDRGRRPDAALAPRRNRDRHPRRGAADSRPCRGRLPDQ